MKAFKITIVITVLLLFANAAFADWTIAVSQDNGAGSKNIIKIELTGDGASLDQNIWSDIEAATDFNSAGLIGKYLYRLKTDPDDSDAPSSTYELTIVDALGDTATLSSRSTSATEYEIISNVTETGGYLTMYGYLYLTCEDIGDGNTTVLYIELVP